MCVLTARHAEAVCYARVAWRHEPTAQHGAGRSELVISLFEDGGARIRRRSTRSACAHGTSGRMASRRTPSTAASESQAAWHRAGRVTSSTLRRYRCRMRLAIPASSQGRRPLVGKSAPYPSGDASSNLVTCETTTWRESPSHATDRLGNVSHIHESRARALGDLCRESVLQGTLSGASEPTTVVLRADVPEAVAPPTIYYGGRSSPDHSTSCEHAQGIFLVGATGQSRAA